MDIKDILKSKSQEEIFKDLEQYEGIYRFELLFKYYFKQEPYNNFLNIQEITKKVDSLCETHSSVIESCVDGNKNKNILETIDNQGNKIETHIVHYLNCSGYIEKIEITIHNFPDVSVSYRYGNPF